MRVYVGDVHYAVYSFHDEQQWYANGWSAKDMGTYNVTFWCYAPVGKCHFFCRRIKR